MPPKENPERACEECIHFFACSRQCGEPMAQRSATGCECYETVKSSMAYYVGTLDGAKGKIPNRLRELAEADKDGTKMGVGCPEYILLFRKLPTDRSKAYADERVSKTKEEYTRAQWQIDAHGFWRSSGNRLITKDELLHTDAGKLQAIYRKYSRDSVYSYDEHVKLAKELDKDGHLPATFMVVAPGSWTDQVWDDINRMRTLNTTQSQRRKENHVCPLQLDIVDSLINRYSNPGNLVLDPFGGLGTVALEAIKAGRRGYTIELNNDYFRDAVGYLKEFDESQQNDNLCLFDVI